MRVPPWFDRARDTHEPWQALRSAGARDDSERYFRQAHRRVASGDARVTAKGKL